MEILGSAKKKNKWNAKRLKELMKVFIGTYYNIPYKKTTRTNNWIIKAIGYIKNSQLNFHVLEMTEEEM
jgi:hypothetical protein